MKCKGWRFSHKARDEVEFGGELEGSELYGSTEKVLGMGWFPLPDLFKFKFRLNFGERKGKVWLEANITREQLMKNPPSMLTRRMVSTPTAGVFDPLSLLTPVLLQAKILLRKSWNHENEQLGWDDPLPNSLRLEWIEFFLLLFDIEGLEFERSLTPPSPTVGLPWLVLFSDGALVSYGACGFIRWKLEDGSVWCRLAMAKGKIAPKCRGTVPRMELCGAVTQVRMEKFIREKTKMNFEKVSHIVDSSTVLGYINKSDSQFKPYEGSFSLTTTSTPASS